MLPALAADTRYNICSYVLMFSRTQNKNRGLLVTNNPLFGGVLSGIRTHDIQNHKLIKGLLNVLTFMCFPLCVVFYGKHLENMFGYVLGFMR